jgi:hypothetical protein
VPSNIPVTRGNTPKPHNSGAGAYTVVIRPSVHGTRYPDVHSSKCSFLGNHEKFTSSPAKPDRIFFGILLPIMAVTVTDTKSVQFAGWRHASPEHLVGLVQ